MEKLMIRRTLEGLIMTAKEKVCVLGLEDAQEDLKAIEKVYMDLVDFWDLDNEYINSWNEKISILKEV